MFRLFRRRPDARTPPSPSTATGPATDDFGDPTTILRESSADEQRAAGETIEAVLATFEAAFGTTAQFLAGPAEEQASYIAHVAELERSFRHEHDDTSGSLALRLIQLWLQALRQRDEAQATTHYRELVRLVAYAKARDTQAPRRSTHRS